MQNSPNTSDSLLLLTEREAAAQLHIARVTLARWRRTGRGPTPVMLGRSVRYRVSDIMCFLAARVVRA